MFGCVIMLFITLTEERFDAGSGLITDLSVAYNVAEITRVLSNGTKPGCVLEMRHGQAHLVKESLAEVLRLIEGG